MKDSSNIETIVPAYRLIRALVFYQFPGFFNVTCQKCNVVPL